MRASLDHEFAEDWVGVCGFVHEGAIGKRHRGATYRYHLECTAGPSRLDTQVANLIKVGESLKKGESKKTGKYLHAVEYRSFLERSGSWSDIKGNDVRKVSH